MSERTSRTGTVRRYLAFDIETAKVLPAHVLDLMTHRPLGIACVATLASGEDQPRLWYGRTRDGAPSGQMTRGEAAELVEYLAEAVDAGFTILTWNGVGFDFEILAEESGELVACEQLALAHVDMMFHVFCERGFALSVDSAAKGMGLPGKSSPVAGWLAPQAWADGRTDAVLKYVSQDVRTTLQLAEACERHCCLRWLSQRGRVQEIWLHRGWLTVDLAMQLPLPDTSWMDDPWSRSKFTGWLESVETAHTSLRGPHARRARRRAGSDELRMG